ncbi:MAG: CPBP family intramembrane metalloprotease [Planctomycetes bacterium]|nr:CPBP family intramembrane metalloprotease [Planctomycetota bacterium]
MSASTRSKKARVVSRRAKRGVLARPLDSLVFLLPLILFYEAVSTAPLEGIAGQSPRVIAFTLIHRFLALFGQVGLWAPPVAVVAILLATHAFSGERWRVHWSEVGRMYIEALALAVPLLLLNLMIPLQAAAETSASLLRQVALGVGAGVYEELVFRLMFITAVFMVGADLLGFDRGATAAVAVLLSAAVFAAHHHHPVGIEPFRFSRFVFRALAGVYLAVIFWYRGYGPAAGCHAAYNVVLALLDHAAE